MQEYIKFSCTSEICYLILECCLTVGGGTPGQRCMMSSKALSIYKLQVSDRNGQVEAFEVELDCNQPGWVGSNCDEAKNLQKYISSISWLYTACVYFNNLECFYFIYLFSW